MKFDQIHWYISTAALLFCFAQPQHRSFPNVWKPDSETPSVSPNLNWVTGNVFLSLRYPLSSDGTDDQESQLHVDTPSLQVLVIPQAHFPLSIAAPPQ